MCKDDDERNAAFALLTRAREIMGNGKAKKSELPHLSKKFGILTYNLALMEVSGNDLLLLPLILTQNLALIHRCCNG